MAHEIETHVDANGNIKACAVFARERAWHNLGEVLPASFTVEEAMQHGHLGGWNVRKAPLYTTVVTGMDDNGVTTVNIPINDRYATIRDNPFVPGQIDALGVVGDWYEPFQNEQCAEFLGAVCGEGGAYIETAASLFDGRRVFFTMKLPTGVLIGGVDPIDSYLCVSTAHDGTAALTGFVTKTRVVCNNTYSFALTRAQHTFKIRHTRKASATVAEARRGLELSFAWDAEFQTMAERMLNTKCTVPQFQIMAKQVIRPEGDKDLTDRQRRADDAILTQMTELFRDAETQANVRGTRYAGFQAVTEWQEHIAPVQLRDRPDNQARAERMASGRLSKYQAAAYRAFALKS